MQAFIVFAAIIAVATAGAVRSSGWGAPPSPSIDLEMAAAAAAVGDGSASADQALLELVSGNAATPASLASVNGVVAAVGQEEDILQIAVADLSSGSTSTLNAVDVENVAIAEDVLEALAVGANYVIVENSANTAAAGEGAIAAEAGSYNNVVSKKH